MTGGSPQRRILLVTNCIGWDGAETQLNYLAIALREAGHEVVMFAIDGVTADVTRLTEAGVKIVPLDASSRVAKLFGTLKIARNARQADVVHCTGWDATLWGRLGAFLARRPVVITEHTPGRHLQVNSRNASRQRPIALHNRILDRVTYATIAVALWQFDLLESEGVRRDSIVHIPNAVPVEELRDRATRGVTREELGIPDDAPVIAHIARFASQKCQPTTLRAALRLKERLSGLRVLFVGTGPEEEMVKREAQDAGADMAIFLGLRADVPRLLRLANLAVLPSTGEGLPMALIEAIVLGTPVVATDVGDVGWLIDRTGGGLCVPLHDDDAFVEACARALTDPDLRAAMTGASERAAAEFDSKKMTKRYEVVLEAAIESMPLAELRQAVGTEA
jgi:glycosyltransferase involved in cell wall biosynthesis